MPSPYMPIPMPIFSRGTIWYTIVKLTTAGPMPASTGIARRRCGDL
jgi:hypothetical protein